VLSNFNHKFEIFHKNVITAIPVTTEKRENKGAQKAVAEKRRGSAVFLPSRHFYL